MHLRQFLPASRIIIQLPRHVQLCNPRERSMIDSSVLCYTYLEVNEQAEKQTIILKLVFFFFFYTCNLFLNTLFEDGAYKLEDQLESYNCQTFRSLEPTPEWQLISQSELWHLQSLQSLCEGMFSLPVLKYPVLHSHTAIISVICFINLSRFIICVNKAERDFNVIYSSDLKFKWAHQSLEGDVKISIPNQSPVVGAVIFAFHKNFQKVSLLLGDPTLLRKELVSF